MSCSLYVFSDLVLVFSMKKAAFNPLLQVLLYSLLSLSSSLLLASFLTLTTLFLQSYNHQQRPQEQQQLAAAATTAACSSASNNSKQCQQQQAVQQQHQQQAAQHQQAVPTAAPTSWQCSSINTAVPTLTSVLRFENSCLRSSQFHFY